MPRYTRSTPAAVRQRSRPKPLTIAEAIEAYLLYHESANSQPATIYQHTRSLGVLKEFCDQHEISLLQDLTTEDVQRWTVELQKTPHPKGKRCARTVSWYVRSARAFYRWCCRRGFCEVDIMTWLDLPKLERPMIRILEEEEFRRLIYACQPDIAEHSASGPHHTARNEALLWLLLDTGIRLSELCKLKLNDFDRARGTIIVFGKGRKERRIALGKNALLVVGRYLTHWRDAFLSAEHDQHMFLTDEGGMKKAGIEMLFRRLKKRAGFDERRVYPHLLRHTFAVRYLMGGGDVFTLQELLGHEDMETIRNYMHLADANVQSQKRKFSPGDMMEMTPKKLKRTGFRKPDKK